MENNKAIPKGFMTVGELAKKMNVTVRTLQYYDRENLFSPSAQSEGGRRLYTDRDTVRLHEILSLKYLGFSLDDIKNNLSSLDTPEQVAEVLSRQEINIGEKIAELKEIKTAIKKLKEETQQMKTVDWGKYADIIALLRMNNDAYWVIKAMDEKFMSRIKNTITPEKGEDYIKIWIRLCEEAAELEKRQIQPESEKGFAVAKAWWDFVTDVTGGDMSLLPYVMKFENDKQLWSTSWREKWEKAKPFIEKALENYFIKSGINPFEAGNAQSPKEARQTEEIAINPKEANYDKNE
ncbi:MAG: MerR family transcriptional regulator [Clostridiales bacterium]|jgi:DNA-binding transcriptional MerR regulator|nr:MerR family transcriptional regulator [Clostridiales bacterium]